MSIYYVPREAVQNGCTARTRRGGSCDGTREHISFYSNRKPSQRDGLLSYAKGTGYTVADTGKIAARTFLKIILRPSVSVGAPSTK